MKKRITLVLLSGIFLSNLSAQDTNEFQRIAKRIMDAYEVGAELEHAPDSAHLYGGAFLGAGSNGRAMPSGYVTYLKDNLLLTSQLSVDFSELDTEKDVSTDFVNGADRLTSTNILTKYEKHDFSTRLDYMPSKGNIFTVGVLESFDHKRVTENTIKNGHDEMGVEQESKYEEQRRSNKDVKLGGLLQYIRDIEDAGRLTTRLNLKYNYKPTDVESDTWAVHSEASLREERQTLYNFDPYAMVKFQSKVWGGFKFGVQEKYTIEDMRISDTTSEFNFNTYSSLTSLSGNYSWAWLELDATFNYENYIHKIDDHKAAKLDKTYNDWMLDAKATFKVTKRSKFAVSYNRDIVRPTYTQLYPFVHIGSSIGVMVVGNRALGPSKNSEVKGSYTYSGKHWTHTHSLAYKRIDDDISQISSFDEISQRSVKTWINDARYSYLRYTAEGEVRYGVFSMTMGFHGQYLDYEGEKVSSDKAWSYSFKARPQFQLPEGWTLATVLLFTGRETHRHYYNRSNFYWSFRAVKQLDPWAIYGFVQDILQPDREQILTNEEYNTTTISKPNTRCLIVGCSYTFGK
jgi:hypothetical protein